MENSEMRNEQILFCRICGRKLLSDSAFCDGCGAKVVAIEAPEPPVTDDVPETVAIPSSFAVVPTIDDPAAEPQDTEVVPADMTSEAKPKKKIWKIIAPILAVAILACAAFFIVPKFIPVAVEEQDINSINGCPEFYNIQFGMTAQQASALVEIEHKAITGYENSFGSVDSSLYLQEGTEYDVYGLPTSHVLCYFDGLKLETILFVFPKKDVSLSKVVDLYTKIYGEPTTRNTLSATWSGALTTIDVFDALLTDGEDEEIIVRYRETPNKQFKNLTFDGPEYDPCNFLTTQIFKKKPSYYTSGLVSGDDYTVDKNDYFTKYTLYPRFEYMGIEEGMTAISFDVDASETEISVCSYLFLLEKEKAADQLTYIKSVLEKEYGTYSNCTYTSMKYDELGIVDLTFTEFISRIKSGTQGLYNIQWDMGLNKVTINFTVDPSKTYYEGSVSTSG